MLGTPIPAESVELKGYRPLRHIKAERVRSMTNRMLMAEFLCFV